MGFMKNSYLWNIKNKNIIYGIVYRLPITMYNE